MFDQFTRFLIVSGTRVFEINFTFQFTKGEFTFLKSGTFFLTSSGVYNGLNLTLLGMIYILSSIY